MTNLQQTLLKFEDFLMMIFIQITIKGLFIYICHVRFLSFYFYFLYFVLLFVFVLWCVNACSEDTPALENCDSKKRHYSNRVVSTERKATSGDLFSPPPEDDFSAGFLSNPITAHWNRFSSFTLLDIQG